MKQKLLLLLTAALVWFTIGCNKSSPPTEPPPDKHPNVEIIVDDLSSTEAWFNISLSDTLINNRVILKLDNITFKEFNLALQDTNLFLDSLDYNKAYTLKGFLFDDDKLINSTETLFRTLDITSSNFSWQIFKAGTVPSNPSGWRDVTIVNENDIWVVGEVYLLDSLGNNDPQAYGAAHWDGIEWSIFGVPYRRSPFLTEFRPGKLRSVINFGSNAVYATSGYNLLKWNGSKWEEKVVTLDVTIYKIWGSDENNIYGAGYNGNVYRYTGNTWEKLPNLTDIHLMDVYGTPDGSKVWICGYSVDMTKSILLEYEGNNGRILWERIGKPPIIQPQYASTVWSGKNNMYFAGGREIYQKYFYSDSIYVIHLINNWPYRIRGQGYNDIFVTGDLGMIWHFNGIAWFLINETSSDDILNSIAANNNTLVAVGTTYEQFPPRALIYLGKR